MLECSVTVTHRKAFSCSHYINVRMQLPLSRRNSFRFHFGSTGWDFFLVQHFHEIIALHLQVPYRPVGKSDPHRHDLEHLPLRDETVTCHLSGEMAQQKESIQNSLEPTAFTVINVQPYLPIHLNDNLFGLRKSG